MGTNCRVYLPAAVRLDDVVTMVGILAGCPHTRNVLHRWVEFGEQRPRSDTSNTPTMANITVPYGDKMRTTTYHFEGDDTDDGARWRLLLPTSNGFWCAVAKRLVLFFGGQLKYRDSGDDAIDLRSPARTNRQLRHNDTQSFRAFHDAMDAEAPLTDAEIAEGIENSAYRVV